MAELALSAPYNEVHKRNGQTILVENFKKRTPDGFESFTSGNAGQTLRGYELHVFDGDNVIQDLTLTYPTLQIRDFELRPLSAFTLNGSRFTNVGTTSMLPFGMTANSLQVLTTDPQIPTVLESMTNVGRFAAAGHLFIGGSARTLFEYTSKTPPGFIGYVKSGAVNIPASTEFIQYSTDA